MKNVWFLIFGLLSMGVGGLLILVMQDVAIHKNWFLGYIVFALMVGVCNLYYFIKRLRDEESQQ